MSAEWLPQQQEVIDKGIFKKKNLVLCWPTGGGKTHIIIEAMIQLAKRKEKSLLLLSTKTAVKEKLLKKIPEQFGQTLDFNCGAVFGGNVYKLIKKDDTFDLRRRRLVFLPKCKIIVGTYESIDKILRTDKKKLSDLKLIGADEIHNLVESSRGATVDKVVTLLRHLNQDAQVILSSASLGNASKLAKWINGETHIYENCTVPIRICFYCFEHKKFEWLDGKSTPSILRSCDGSSNKRVFFNKLGDIVTKRKKQHLIFQGTRQKSRAYAWSYTKYHESNSDEERPLSSIDRMIGAKTGCDTAGMFSKERDRITNTYLDNDENKRLTSLHCTTTLAESFDSKTSLVVISDIEFAGTIMSSIDLEQMIGRIREPFIDSNRAKYGIAVVIIKNHEEKKVVEEKLEEQPEIVSKLEDKEKFSEQLLSLFGEYNESDTKEIFKKSFFGVSSPDKLNRYFQDTQDMLKKQGFIDSNGFLTTLGRETNKFFIPISTAKALYDKKDAFKNLTEIPCLEKIIEELSSVPEIKRSFRYKDKENLQSFILLYCYTVTPAQLCKTFGITIPDFILLMHSIGRYVNFLQMITNNSSITRWQNSITIGVPPNFLDVFPSSLSQGSKCRYEFRKTVKNLIKTGRYVIDLKNLKSLREEPLWDYIFTAYASPYTEQVPSNVLEAFSDEFENYSLLADVFAEDLINEFKKYLEEDQGYDVETIGYNKNEVVGEDFAFRFELENFAFCFWIMGNDCIEKKIHKILHEFYKSEGILYRLQLSGN